MNLNKKTILMQVFLICFLSLNISVLKSHGQHKIEEIGTVIAHSKASSKVYLGSPSILILNNGSYLASYDEFGPNSNNKTTPITHIAISKDKGRTWLKTISLDNIMWGNLFSHDGIIYLMGTSKVYGDLVIRKSIDNGKTWTEVRDNNSGLLRNDFEYHTAPVPVVTYKDRIYRALEVRNPGYGWGFNLEVLLISAPINADLLKAENWVVSNRLHFDQRWLGTAWLEGNVLVTPENKLVNILRVHYLENGGKVAKVHYDAEKNKISFNPDKDFLNFPGGSKKFTIRFDEKTKRYWTLSNHIKDIGYNPERTRNCLTLSSSKDLMNWEVHEEILYHPDLEKHGFQYVDWQFDGRDIIAIIRTAYDDTFGGADNQHNSNYIVFKRINNYNELSKNKKATYYNFLK
ncbi:sialidase family protein [Polaribacter sp. Hel_I_88]|uniref:sialidase family protein n=1 Tax=Polaribacter sp. Hel_I_88 TaxID=1250006 RepID=UPI00068F2F9A|nr:sialidase family protein [Polaribacter sp. Hel_I_88]